MRHRAPGAGSLSLASRRAALRMGVAAGLAMVLPKAMAEFPLVSPGASYTGARLLRRMDPQGMPAMAPDALGPVTFFIFPVAVAASPFDIYVADAGLAALFRYDPMLDVMAAVPGVRVTEATRIGALRDGSVVVAEGNQGVARQFSRSGRFVQAIDPQNTGSRFDEVLVDTATGRFIGLDRIRRRIEEVNPLGRSGAILPEGLLPDLPGTMALDNQVLYVAGQDCKCVLAIDLFRRGRQVLTMDVTRVSAMAAGEGWLIIADDVERRLSIYRNHVLVADPGYDTLKLTNPRGMAIARNILYVADAGARRIATFRLRP